MFIRFDRIHERDRQTVWDRRTHGRTDGHRTTAQAANIGLQRIARQNDVAKVMRFGGSKLVGYHSRFPNSG